MTYPDDILKKVKQFGYLQYDVKKIVSILNIEDVETFVQDIQNVDEPLCVMYQSGLNTGLFNLDAAEFKLKSAEADQARIDLEREKKLDILINDYLGFNDD